MSERTSMRKIKDILRLKWELRMSNRDIAKSVQISPNTVGDCLKRAKAAGLALPLPSGLDDEQLEQMLYQPKRNKSPQESRNIDWGYINQERKRKGVTLELLWHEYRSQYSEGISYSRFCSLYRQWRKQIDCCMRQSYKVGQKMFVDYAGMTVPIFNAISGEITEAQIFVACLGASNYTFVEATQSQALPDWIGSHVRAFNYFGGVPEIVVPDNLKSGVHKAHLYEPDINPTYDDMANHYGVAVIPTRVAAPRDKSKVEEAVQYIERQILAKLRNRKFFSILELNKAIKPLLEELNSKPFQKLPGSRKSQFEDLEKAALRPLPQTPYTFAEWKKARLGVDYHIVLDDHYYSAPYTLIKKVLDLRFSATTVEVFYRGKRVASHKRSYKKGGFTTLPEHMPESHRHVAEWTPERLINWAEKNGENTAKFAQQMIVSRKHPQQAFRSCMGIMRLSKSYGNGRLENACKRALAIGTYSYKSVLSILKNNLDKLALPNQQEQLHITEINHEYVRGKNYFN